MNPSFRTVPLFTAEKIQHRIRELAGELARVEAGNRSLVAVAVLKGSFMFLADLARALHAEGFDLRIEFLHLGSYGRATETSGHVTVFQPVTLSVQDCDVLLVDDIFDTGLTLQAARDLLRAAGARRIITCVLLDKPARHRVALKADYAGFVVDDCFVVGYGLDFDSRYRHLPYLARLEPESAEQES